MTWIVSFFTAFASSAFLKPLLTRVLITLGFSVITYASVGVAMSSYYATMVDNYSSLPSDVLTVLAMARIPDAMNVVLSAWVSSLAIRGLTAAGSIKRAVWRPGQSGDLFGAG
jgi:hypothetical protein